MWIQEFCVPVTLIQYIVRENFKPTINLHIIFYTFHYGGK